MIIDFHAHVMPLADHGSDGKETTERQLQLIAAGGTEAVVATPHFYPHRHNIASFQARRERALNLLSECRIPQGLKIFLGAEVQVCEGLEEMEELPLLCIEGTRTILLEMPMGKWSDRLIDTVVAIAESGYTPVLAHVDRYPRRNVEALLKKGLHAQLNAEAFGRFFGKRNARRYLRLGSVVALGSDLHGAEENGYAPFLHMRAHLGACADGVFAASAALLNGAVNIVESFKTTPV